MTRPAPYQGSDGAAARDLAAVPSAVGLALSRRPGNGSSRPIWIARSIGLSVPTMEFGFLRRLLGTTSLTVDQWAICIVISPSLIMVEAVRTLLEARTGDEPVATSSAPVAATA